MSKKKILVQQQGTPNGTPDQSDDEDKEDGPEIPIEMLESFDEKDLSNCSVEPLFSRNRESLGKSVISYQSTTPPDSEDENMRDDPLPLIGGKGKVAERHSVLLVGRGAREIETATPDGSEDEDESKKILPAGGEPRETAPKPEDDEERHTVLFVGRGAREVGTETPAESEDEDGSEKTLPAGGEPREVAPKMQPFIPIKADPGIIDQDAGVPFGLVNK